MTLLHRKSAPFQPGDQVGLLCSNTDGDTTYGVATIDTITPISAGRYRLGMERPRGRHPITDRTCARVEVIVDRDGRDPAGFLDRLA